MKGREEKGKGREDKRRGEKRWEQMTHEKKREEIRIAERDKMKSKSKKREQEEER